MKNCAVLSSALALLLLTGCSSSFTSTVLPAASTSSASISGRAHGGRQPIVGAHIYLLEANTTAYAGPGIAATPANASKSLLTTGDDSDSIGTFVYTKSDGSFSVSNDYTCDTGAQVYLLSLGGKPDGVNQNSAAGLMAVLGTCGSSFSSATTVNMNEASTVAAAYAFAGFATDATHVGAPSSTDATAGNALAAAFANAAQIYDISVNPFTSSNNGARSTNPVGSGTISTALANTVANILASCVNTSGTASTQCADLFALHSLGSTGTAATDTATAAIFLAHNPAFTSVYNATGVVGAATPFTPWDSTAAPNDFSISVQYSQYTSPFPHSLISDSAGNIDTADHYDVYSISPTGSFLSAPNGVGNLPTNLSMDPSGHLYVGIADDWCIEEYKPNLSLAANLFIGACNHFDGVAADRDGNIWGSWNVKSGYYTSTPIAIGATNGQGGSVDYEDALPGISYDIAVDASGYVWTAEATDNLIYRFAETSSSVSGPTTYPLSGGVQPSVLAIDASGQLWIASGTGASLSVYNNGTLVNSYTVGSAPFRGMAVDGDSRIWLTNSNNQIAVASNSGATVASGLTGDQAPNGVYGITVDPLGNVWVGNNGNNTIVEYFGIATPVAQPLALDAKNNQLGQRP